MQEIVLILDTSILVKHISLNSPEFDSIAELSRINAIKLKIPEIVDKEFLSHKNAELITHFDTVLASLKQLQKKSHLHSIQIGLEIEKFQELKISALTEIENEWMKYKSEKKISIIPFSINATNKVFRDYFKGNPPFKNIKNRNDIPDAFILHSILSLTNHNNLHFVCADRTLSSSVANNNIKTYDCVADFLLLPEIKPKLKELEDLSSVENELNIIKENNVLMKQYVLDYIKNAIPVELYDFTGNRSYHLDKLVELHEIKSILFELNKTRLFDSNILVIPVSLKASVELEMTYNRRDYLDNTLSASEMYRKIIDLWKLKTTEEEIVVHEDSVVDLELTLKIELCKPFNLKEAKISYSDITSKYLIIDWLKRNQK